MITEKLKNTETYALRTLDNTVKGQVFWLICQGGQGNIEPAEVINKTQNNVSKSDWIWD